MMLLKIYSFVINSCLKKSRWSSSGAVSAAYNGTARTLHSKACRYRDYRLLENLLFAGYLLVSIHPAKSMRDYSTNEARIRLYKSLLLPRGKAGDSVAAQRYR